MWGRGAETGGRPPAPAGSSPKSAWLVEASPAVSDPLGEKPAQQASSVGRAGHGGGSPRAGGAQAVTCQGAGRGAAWGNVSGWLSQPTTLSVVGPERQALSRPGPLRTEPRGLGASSELPSVGKLERTQLVLGCGRREVGPPGVGPTVPPPLSGGPSSRALRPSSPTPPVTQCGSKAPGTHHACVALPGCARPWHTCVWARRWKAASPGLGTRLRSLGVRVELPLPWPTWERPHLHGGCQGGVPASHFCPVSIGHRPLAWGQTDRLLRTLS